jgi:hypothetical protein
MASKRYKKGDRIRQPTYGDGTVDRIENNFYVIDFDNQVKFIKYQIDLANLEPSSEPAPVRLNQARPVVRGSGRTREGGVAGSTLLDYSFADLRRTLVLMPALSSGWRKRTKVTGFVGITKDIDLIGDCPIRAQVQLFYEGGGSRAHEVPVLADTSGPQEVRYIPLREEDFVTTEVKVERSPIQYEVKDGHLVVNVALFDPSGRLNPDLWKTMKKFSDWSYTFGCRKNGSRYVHFQKLQLWSREPKAGYKFQVKIEFMAHRALKPPDVYDWDSPFVSGGLPSLGKKQ